VPTAKPPTRRATRIRPPVRSDAAHPARDQPTLFNLPDLAPIGVPATGATYQTSLYRLDRIPPTPAGLHQALDHAYLAEHGFTARETRVADAAALLVHGTVTRDRAEWCDVLTALTGQPVTLGHRSGGGALLVAVDDDVYALTYGHLGRHMVDLDWAGPGFGIGFAVRSIARAEVSQVRRRLFGTHGRIDRNLVPGGQHIRMYGIDGWGEIVGALSGRVDNPRLTACRLTGRSTPIHGSDCLRVQLAVDPVALLADLREISRVCRREAPYPDLEFVTQIRPVADTDPRVPELEGRVDELLGADDPVELGLAVPGRLLTRIEDVRSYRVRVAGRGTPVPAELTLDDLLARTRGLPDGFRWAALRAGRVAAFSDVAGRDETASTAGSAWLTAQLAHGASQLLLHEGAWYEIGDRHREFLHREIAGILGRPASVALPPWPAGWDEQRYNRQAAAPGSGFVLLDRRLVKTAQHRRGIEACDLLGPDGELIHVKRADGSAPLSHLFAQGQVAVDALTYEPDARQRLVDLVHADRPGHWIGPDFRPRRVVYAIALRSGPLTPASLFTFAQVALYRAVKGLRAEGVEVEVVGVPVV
jgi:uncharacterized protein (TIGR04141 family)